MLCAKFQVFFPWCGFRDTEVQSFSVYPIWLPHHVTHDIIVIIKMFYMSRRTNGENFVSIRQAVAERNTKVLCGQTDKQTDPNAIPSPKLKRLHHLKQKYVSLFTSINVQTKQMWTMIHMDKPHNAADWLFEDRCTAIGSWQVM